MTVLVFPGQGSQWPGMASDLLDASEVFAGRLRQCADAIEAHVDWSVEDVLRQRQGAAALDRVEVVQPVLYAVHVALAEMWLADGLLVDAVVGQSQGEVAAACVAGAISLQDAARIIVMRSQLFAEELVGRGAIASIGLPECEIAPYLTAYAGDLDIAGVIGSRTVTVAGEMVALKELVAQLNQRGIKATVVPASIPSHSPFIDPLRDELASRLGEVRPRRGRIPM